VKPRSVLLLALLIFVAAGAVLAAGFPQGPVRGLDGPAPASALPILSPSPFHAGLPDETAQRIAASADYRDPAVDHFVATRAATPVGMNTIARVCDLWELIYTRWHYVRGPPDYSRYQPASSSITAGLNGNCLDYAILNAAVVKSLGGDARVVIAGNPEEGNHAYAEVYVGDTIADIQPVGDYIARRYNTTTINWHTVAGSGGKTEYWLNLDWQARYPGGPFYADNGTYYATYLTGTGQRYEDNGTPVPGVR
jgi:transglutaminase-like putative cysteine protease